MFTRILHSFQHFPATEDLFSKQKLTDFPNQPVFSGEGGIRTHAPFRTNGFQDRLVMTTSIPLQFLSEDNQRRFNFATLVILSHL
jgi:hypothetical protein